MKERLIIPKTLINYMSKKTITNESVRDVEYDGDKKFEEWSDEELAKLFYDCWRQIEINDVFSMSDLQHREKTAQLLSDRGYEIDFSNPPSIYKYE